VSSGVRRSQSPQRSALTLPSLELLAGYGALAAELGGVVLGAARWAQLDAGCRMIVAWLGASALADIAEFIAAPIWHNVQPVARVWYVLSVSFALLSLAAFQHVRRRATVIHGVIGVYLVAWVLLLMTVEPLKNYSAYIGPLHGLLILAAAGITLFRRVAVTRRDLLADPAFLVATALSVYAIPATFRTLIAQILVNGPVSRLINFYAICSVISLFAVLIVIDALLVRTSRPAPVST
jgi:hypothetical protein